MSSHSSSSSWSSACLLARKYCSGPTLLPPRNPPPKTGLGGRPPKAPPMIPPSNPPPPKGDCGRLPPNPKAGPPCPGFPYWFCCGCTWLEAVDAPLAKAPVCPSWEVAWELAKLCDEVSPIFPKFWLCDLEPAFEDVCVPVPVANEPAFAAEPEFDCCCCGPKPSCSPFEPTFVFKFRFPICRLWPKLPLCPPSVE